MSLTNGSRDSVQAFVREFAIRWPCAYGVPLRSIAALGAYDPGRKVPGYEVSPTVYLVGPDRRVRWSDRQRRLRHEDRKAWLADLESALKQQLAATAGSATTSSDKRTR